MPTIQRTLFSKQIEFVRSEERHVLQSGGFGSGKSLALGMKLISRACRPGAREGLVRKTLVSLKKSTLKTLLDGDGDNPPVLPPGSYTHNKSENIIRIKGGGEILYFGMDDPQNLGSLNMTGIACDELIQFTRDDWTWMQGRCRVSVNGLENQIYGATNPGAPSHWLVELFGLALGHRPQPGYKTIRTKTTDNPALPKTYVDSVRTLPGVAYKRFFLGEWCGADGLVYDTFSRDIHVRSRPGPWARTIIGVDEGYTNPFVCLVVRVDGDGRVHVEAEHYESKMVRDDKVSVIRRMAQDAEMVVIDPSAAELIETVRSTGVNVIPADNDIVSGLHRVRSRLATAGDGQPRFTCEPACENLVREFESYEFGTDSAKRMTDKPRKQFDHSMDALRYAVAYIDPPQAVVQSIHFGKQQDEQRDVTLTSDYGWEAWQ